METEGIYEVKQELNAQRGNCGIEGLEDRTVNRFVRTTHDKGEASDTQCSNLQVSSLSLHHVRSLQPSSTPLSHLVRRTRQSAEWSVRRKGDDLEEASTLWQRLDPHVFGTARPVYAHSARPKRLSVAVSLLHLASLSLIIVHAISGGLYDSRAATGQAQSGESDS